MRFVSLIFLPLLGGLLITPLVEAACTAGNPNANIAERTPSSEFADHGDGTVTHIKTGLMWKRCAQGQTWTGTTCTGTASTYNWADALGQSVTDTFASNTDWRLPTQAELDSIVETCGYAPSVNQAVFPATATGKFWTSTTYLSGAGFAWLASFSSGAVGAEPKSYLAAVRLVRAGVGHDSFDLMSISVPGAPTSVTATAGNATASLSFSAPSSNGGGTIDSYRATCNPGAITASNAVSPIFVTGLSNGTAYTCTVAAHNIAGWGAESVATSSFTPLAVPAAPTNVSAVAGPASATVSFNSSAGATSYTVTCIATGHTTRTATGSSSPIRVLSLDPDIEYSCTVTATNGSGTSGASAATTVTPAPRKKSLSPLLLLLLD